MTKSGFNRNFKDGVAGLRGGAGNASSGFQSAEKRIIAASVWDDSVPIGYWNFDENTGTTLNDVSSAGNNIDGTLKGTSSDYPDWDATNKVRGDSSLVFDGGGSNQYVWAADNNVLDFDQAASEPFTLSAWFKRDHTGTPYGYECIIAKQSNLVATGEAWRGWSMYLHTDFHEPTFLLSDGSNHLRMKYNSTMSDTSWHHFVVTYSAAAAAKSDVKMYFDGSPVTVTQIEDSLITSMTTSNSQDFSVGSFSDNPNGVGNGLYHFGGNIDEVAIWNRVLEADEVTDVYNSGAGNDLTDGIPKS